VTLDDGDYRIAAEVARSTLATQGFTLKRIDAQIAGAKAGLDQARANKTALQAALENAQKAYDRANQLHQSDFGSQATLDGATAALDQAKAGLAGADAGIAAAQANISVLEAQHAEAQSQVKSLQLALDKAERDLGFTVLRAPYDGVVGNIAVQKGDLVSPGQRLAALVPVNDLYIEANFKETQIARLVPGETVDVHVDAYGAEPIKGTVVSLSPASGSVFSLLPADNATGNFTKVVQRVPVRIALPQDALESGRLRAGLSVMVDVDSRTAPDGAAATDIASAK
jgi:membrane fusion protein, multidrug efflux system